MIVATVVLWVPCFGLIDLAEYATGAPDRSSNGVLDIGWGAIFGAVLPLGLLAQLRRPRRRIAGLQLVGVVIVALAIAAVASEAWSYLLLVAALAAGLAVILALHPARGSFLSIEPDRRRRSLSLLALIATVPCLAYASRMASAGRRGLPPDDEVSIGLHHWTAMAALALSIVLLLALASLAPAGWPLPALGAALLAGAFGLASLSVAHADDPAGEGRIWGSIAIAFAIAVVCVTLRELRRSRAAAA